MIMSGSSMPGSGPMSESSSHGEERRRAKRKRNHWCALDSTKDPRALTRKDAEGMVTRCTGSENQRAWIARDGSLRGSSRASESLVWYLQMDLMVFQATHELQAFVVLFCCALSSGLAKRLRSPSSSWSSTVVLVPSTGIRTWNWTYAP